MDCDGWRLLVSSAGLSELQKVARVGGAKCPKELDNSSSNNNNV